MAGIWLRAAAIAFMVGWTACGTAARTADESGEELGEVEQPEIYGKDDRVSVTQSRNFFAIQAAKSVALVLWSPLGPGLENVDTAEPCVIGGASPSTGSCRIANDPNTMAKMLCANERFANEPAAPDDSCTAFLVAPNLVATASHCIHTSSGAQKALKHFAFVFGVQSTSAFASVPRSAIYRPIEVKRFGNPKSAEDDFAILRLDRNVTGREPLAVRRSGTLGIGISLYALGHSGGNPMKHSVARVRGSGPGNLFFADLDVFPGASGGPVFNAETHEVEGIMVTGSVQSQLTADPKAGCNRWTKCSTLNPGTDPECYGVGVLRITHDLSKIPERCPAGNGPTNHGRTVTQNERWTAAGNPHVVSGSLWIPSGVTLTLDPCVEVKLPADAEILVEGKLIAKGTGSKRVAFGPASTSRWGGIQWSVRAWRTSPTRRFGRRPITASMSSGTPTRHSRSSSRCAV